MSKSEVLTSRIIKIVESNKNPILAWSGGKDSTLILNIILEMGYKIAILSFNHFWTHYQKAFIAETVRINKLTVFFYKPTEVAYIGNSIVAYYKIANNKIPVVFDCIENTKRCGLDIGNKAVSSNTPNYIWDTTILGTKKSDEHELVKEYNFSQLDTSEHRYEFPLWDFTDEEVMEEIKTRNYKIDDRIYIDGDPSADTGNFLACMRCVGTEDVFCPKEKKVIGGIW